VQVALDLEQVSAVQFEAGDYDGSRASAERTLAILEREVGPANVDLSVPLVQLGLIDLRQQRYSGARQHLERALAIDQAALGAGSSELAPDLVSLATLALQQHDREGARPWVARARAAMEAAGDAPFAFAPSVLLAEAELELADDKPQSACEKLEGVVAQKPGLTGARLETAEAKFALARALWDSRGDRARARRLAQEARSDYAKGGAGDEADVKEIDRWLASHSTG
jgi:serine/threonine-protein kinase